MPTRGVVMVEDDVTGVRWTETTKTLWLRTKAIAAKRVTRNQDHGRGRVRKSEVVWEPSGLDVTRSGWGFPSA